MKGKSNVQRAAGGLIGLVVAMLLETVLLIIRTSDYSKPSKSPKRGKTKHAAEKPAPSTSTQEAAQSSKGDSSTEPKKEK